MGEKLKSFLKSVPTGVWVGVGVILLVTIWASYATGSVAGCNECKA